MNLKVKKRDSISVKEIHTPARPCSARVRVDKLTDEVRFRATDNCSPWSKNAKCTDSRSAGSGRQHVGQRAISRGRYGKRENMKQRIYRHKTTANLCLVCGALGSGSRRP